MQHHELCGQPQLLLIETLPEGELSSRSRQVIYNLDTTSVQAGIGARLGERRTTLFRFGDRVYVLDNRESGSVANILLHGLLGDIDGEPVVISPLYRQRIRPRDGWPYSGSEQMARAWLVRVENGKVWVGSQQLLVRAKAS